MGDTNGPGGPVQAQPAVLSGSSAIPAGGTAASNGILDTCMHSLSDLLNCLAPLAGEQIIGPAATGLMEALDAFGVGLTGSLTCFGSGMKVMAQGLEEAAQLFSTTDAQLASTLQNLEALLPPVITVSTTLTPNTLAKPTSTEAASFSSLVHGQPIFTTLTTTSLAIHTPDPPPPSFFDQVGNFFTTAWNDSGGKVVHFVSQHPMLAALTILTLPADPFTGGGATEGMVAVDASAAAADAATISADAGEVATTGASTAAAGESGAVAAVGTSPVASSTLPATFTDDELYQLQVLSQLDFETPDLASLAGISP
jgi:hypothetical protein